MIAHQLFVGATLPNGANGGYGPPDLKPRNGFLVMADHIVPHFHNDDGVRAIDIGVKEFMCVGASPPFDHPHVYLDIGDANEIVCPYCSTLYRHRPDLGPAETVPPGHLYRERAA